MDKLIIEGGVPLTGVVHVSGSKNAALPILMGSILLDEPVTYTNVPDLRDIRTTFKLLELLGCPNAFENGQVTVTPGALSPEAPYELVKTMRASVLVLGPLLARLGEARVAMPGGCAIGARPVDLHLSALEKMGARFDLEDGYILGRCRKLNGAHIHFDFPTVGGTENLLMAAALADGETILENAAREPEVVDLARFLIACGARIEGHGTSVIRIQGVPRLGGCTYRIMPDRIEAGTLLAAAGITDGELLLTDCPFEELDAVIAKMRQMGMEIEPTADGVLARRSCALRGVDVTTQPFPGFPTDMQPQIAVCMSLASGVSVITESIYDTRFGYCAELNRMGASIKVDTKVAIITGVEKLHGCTYSIIPDQIEAGSYMVAAAATGGDVLIKNVTPKHLEPITAKLRRAGAEVEEFDDAVRVRRTGDILPLKINTMPHPGFPTDMQPLMGVLLSVAKGTSTVTESVWDNRFRYVDELRKMGANVQVDGQVAVFEGVEKLSPAPLRASDLRAGAAMVVAALMADGTSEIEEIGHIERGYENIVEKLRGLGADIRKVERMPAALEQAL